MLKQIYIRNFILIDELEVSFNSGMSVITGETGAGKSILFGALSLLKGRRADLAELKDKSEKCIIEARIDVSKYKLRNAFEREGLDYQEEAIFRRELSPQGKSRAFINDTPVRLEQMQQLGDLLFDIHSQHQSIQLNEVSYRLQILDELADSKTLLKDYQGLYLEYKSTLNELDRLKELARNAIQEEDYLQFQFDELEELKLKAGEFADLESEHQLLANGEELLSLAASSYSFLESEENSTLHSLGQAAKKLEELAALNPSMRDVFERFQSSFIELKDISNEIEAFKDNFDFDPKRLEYLEERMADVHRLKRKHGVEEAEELIKISKEIEDKLLSIGSFEKEIELFESRVKSLYAELIVAANNLSEKRKASFSWIKESIENTLKKLGIPEAQFFLQSDEVELNQNGIDKIDFLFSANLGKAVQSVRKVASGGELSRIVLALKRELARKKHMPALFFDEIDTGVSGEVADQLGNILKEMADSHQIVSITHLPQLAAKGKFHYFVYKTTVDENSNTFMKLLTEDERVNELAKMLSGEKVSEAAVNNAKELLAR